MAAFVLLIEGLVFVLVQLVLQVSLLVLVSQVVKLAKITFHISLVLCVLAIHNAKLAMLSARLLREVGLVVLQLLGLLFDDLDLSVENELLTLDLKTLLVQVLQVPIKVALHLSVLCLQQTDMLMRCFIVIVETANARLLLILDDLLAQDLQLKLHEVDLLLQVDDVIVGGVDVGVLAKLTRCQLFFLLSAEIHRNCGIVSGVIAEATATKVATPFQTAASYFNSNSN